MERRWCLSGSNFMFCIIHRWCILAPSQGVRMNKGILYALGAYFVWGLFPIYWKWLQAVDALQLIGHRIAWSFILLLAIILFTRRWPALRAVAFERRTLIIYSIAALLISANWLVYVWA